MNRIKEALEQKGLTQIWLADRLGKTYNMVELLVSNKTERDNK